MDAFVQRAGLIYSFTRATEEVMVTTAYKQATATANAVSNAFTAMKNAEADFAILPAVATAATRATVPDFMFFPMFAMAYVPVTNLPELLGIQRLVLSQVTVARIFQGLVTMWNDPMIAATNPPNVGLPNKPIEVVLLKEAQSYIDTFVINMRLIDPLNFTVPFVNAFTAPPWPTANYAKFKWVDAHRDVTSYVLGNPYSIGLSYFNVAKSFKAQIARLINDYGNAVDPTYLSTSFAFAERAMLSQRAPDGAIVKSQPLDLLRPPGPNSWPWLQISTLVVPRTFSRGESCRARSELVKFIRWMFHSTQITDVLATLEGVAVVDDTLNKGLLIEETILTQTTCGDALINGGTEDTIQSGGAPASTAHTSIRTVMNQHYSLEKKQTYWYRNMDEAEALAGTMDPVGRPDVSWIYPTTFYDMYPGVLEGHLANGLTMVHVAMFGSLPIFNLPEDVKPRMQSSLPLVFDMETLALIFLGEIASWTDPRLATHAPNLAAAFAGASTSDITVVVCGTGRPADAAFTAMSNHLMQALSRTDTFRTLGFNYSLPADWRPMTARMAANGVRFEYVQGEARLEAAVAKTPGAIGYMLAANNFATIENEIQIAMPVALDAANPSVLTYVPVAATPDNYLACAAAQEPTSSGLIIPRTNRVTGPQWQSCWPILMFSSLGIATDVRTVTTDRFGNSHVSSDLQSLCARQKKLVEFARYWAYLPEVNMPMRLSGRVALSELKPWEAEITRALFALNCGGEPILWTRPVVWKLSGAIATFGVAITLIGLILTLTTAALVIAFRRRTIIYSSNVARQLMVLCGLALMFCAPILFSAAPTVDSCNLLSWLLLIGASLAFGPICGRLRRVYVASRKRKALRRKWMEVARMWMWPAGLLAVDIIVLAIAQSGEGLLRPITTTRLENSADHQYTLCAVPSAYLPHAAVLAGVHLIALLWTALMAFQVRHITTAYKESANMSWAVWNAVLSTLLIVPLIVLTGGLQGDAGVFLLMFLVSWIALCTLGFDFGYKLWTLLGEEIALARERASRSSRSGMTNSGKTTGTGSHTSGSGTGSGTGSGATGLSVLEMPILDGVTSVSTIEQYILALERQLRLARDTRFSQFGATAKSSAGKSEAVNAGGLRHRSRGVLAEDSVLSSDDASLAHAPAGPLTMSHLRLDAGPSPSIVVSPVQCASISPHPARPLSLYRPPAAHARPPSLGVPVSSRSPMRIGLGHPARSPSGSPNADAIGGRTYSPRSAQAAATAAASAGRASPLTRPPAMQSTWPAQH